MASNEDYADVKTKTGVTRVVFLANYLDKNKPSKGGLSENDPEIDQRAHKENRDFFKQANKLKKKVREKIKRDCKI